MKKILCDWCMKEVEKKDMYALTSEGNICKKCIKDKN